MVKVPVVLQAPHESAAVQARTRQYQVPLGSGSMLTLWMPVAMCGLTYSGLEKLLLLSTWTR